MRLRSLTQIGKGIVTQAKHGQLGARMQARAGGGYPSLRGVG